MVLLVLLAGGASAQATFDAKGRRYQCLPGDWTWQRAAATGSAIGAVAGAPVCAARAQPVRDPEAAAGRATGHTHGEFARNRRLSEDQSLKADVRSLHLSSCENYAELGSPSRASGSPRHGNRQGKARHSKAGIEPDLPEWSGGPNVKGLVMYDLDEAAHEAAKQTAHDVAHEAAEEVAKEAAEEAYKEAYEEAYREVYEEVFKEAFEEALHAFKNRREYA
jgi:hypothetical protein